MSVTNQAAIAALAPRATWLNANAQFRSDILPSARLPASLCQASSNPKIPLARGPFPRHTVPVPARAALPFFSSPPSSSFSFP
eukprot:CAMPEP_0198727658 /NCGR_PEP_ID=MMETSP1475-20131203/4704_1 /TAXON_ID= ORGANISM="Unidentified sp., Strain CCMP1999" /NCGR_SAMPLE_ID=MMETSP1475 /ASSEMBLY_ACC=CAM_ASM_001111 /LENGTH=82 /DNA_ID=CAMNT_0044489743 /DNA_START=500 /DNA_END=744 /DNA_ORIENTATION=-